MKPFLLLVFTLFLFAVLAAGCVFESRSNRDRLLSPPETYMNVGNHGPVPTAPWWHAFNDPALDRLIDQTLTDNPDLAQAWARLREAQAIAAREGGLLLPTLTMEGSGSRSQQLGFTGTSRSTTWTGSLAAAYEIDLWKKLHQRTRAKLFAASAAHLNAQALSLTLAAQVADLYFEALALRREIILAQAIEQNSAATLDLLEHRYDQGILAADQLYDAKEELALARDELPRLQSTLDAVKSSLAVLAGRFPENRELPDLGRELPLPPPPPATGIPAQLLEWRPDLAAAKRTLAARDQEVAAAISDRLPTLTIAGSLGTSRLDLDHLVSSATIWNVLLEIAAPVFDGGRRRAEVARAQAAYDQALAAYKKTLLAAVKEVEDALSARTHAEKRHALAMERLETARQDLDRAETQYRQGVIDGVALLRAHRSYLLAANGEILARRRFLAEHVTLARALGAPWPEPPFPPPEGISAPHETPPASAELFKDTP